jgi:hypothetical protein
VVDRYESGETIREAVEEAREAPDDRSAQRVLEAAVCSLLSS